ncbi:MAG: endonuclease/exonuclease/phosphatase family protein [Deltaproteobacteria bacterium]|nr:endonuclease/exonuclease/phosphatase family protein [Deltaproteobacteria bacterium]
MRRLVLFFLLSLSACPPSPPGEAPDACVPLICEVDWCGHLDDGCAGTLECGGCAAPKTCGSRIPNLCSEPSCVPESSAVLCSRSGKSCGELRATDSCGVARTVSCGPCSDGGCLAESDARLCSDHGKTCGPLAATDACGVARQVSCGECPDGGCEPESDPELCLAHQRPCGPLEVTDRCGQARTVNCGDTCPDAGCQEYAPAMCARLGKDCGSLSAEDLCGNLRTIYCGYCRAPNACGTNHVCACTPKTCADLGRNCGVVPDDCGGEVDCGPCPGGSTPPPYCIRVASANLTSGSAQSYDPGEGIRILQGLKPDVVMIQEFNYGSKTEQDIRSMVVTAFGPGFWHFREPGDPIPNGIISRFPIIAAGEWQDSWAPDRDFVWAHLDVPGPKDLWVVSLHLLTGNAGERDAQASAVVSNIQRTMTSGDYLLIGGDLNTSSRGQSCIETLGQVVSTSGPYPEDQNGNTDTNATRSDPLDWVLANSRLRNLEADVRIGSSSFPDGLVFDSRVFRPLSAIPPVLEGDSEATFMQHMAVVRQFCLPVQ